MLSCFLSGSRVLCFAEHPHHGGLRAIREHGTAHAEHNRCVEDRLGGPSYTGEREGPYEKKLTTFCASSTRAYSLPYTSPYVTKSVFSSAAIVPFSLGRSNEYSAVEQLVYSITRRNNKFNYKPPQFSLQGVRGCFK